MVFIYLLAGSLVLEGFLYTKLGWRLKTGLIVILTAVVSVASSSMLIAAFGAVSLVLFGLSLLRIGNYLRIGKKRMHDEYLKRATRRTSFWAALLSLIPLFIAFADAPVTMQHNLLYVLAAVQATAAASIMVILLYNLKKTAYRQGEVFYADKELPTLSVLIPARNETTDLELCLRSCLASDYPKLEIVVLDDCSQLKTSEVIKKFAQDGVRFIKGVEPDGKWLAKNAAYEKLRHEASGDILLFCGVDVRFGPHAFRALVTELLARDKQMISILPRRFSSNLSHAFVQPVRYWWELVLPRKLLNKPAVLSTCWLIKKKKLDKLGGLAAVSRSIIPERFFARELIKTNDYSFIRANDILDVQTAKSFQEQRDTAIRVKYPQFSKRPELTLLVAISELILLVGPFGGIVVGLLNGDSLLLFLGAVSSLLLLLAHITIIYVTNPVNVLAAIWNLPYAVLVDVWLMLWSMGKYEFGEVNWKDRNICIPVMHVVPRLPDLPKD